MASMHSAFGRSSEAIVSAGQAPSVGEGEGGGIPEGGELSFSDLYETLNRAVEERGYQGRVEVLEGGSEFVTVRFSESVLFKPDSPVMMSQGETALEAIGTILLETQKEIGHIEIGGHTAFIGEEADQSMFAWELSSNRAITVLHFFYSNLGFAQEKMNIAGFSHFVPVAPNDTEQSRAKNRRVELRITAKTPELSSNFGADLPFA